jgi:hypothetical protein
MGVQREYLNDATPFSSANGAVGLYGIFIIFDALMWTLRYKAFVSLIYILL